jgi:hypothetical protein
LLPEEDVGASSAEMGASSAEMGASSAEMGAPSAEMGASSAEMGAPSAEMGASSAEGVDEAKPENEAKGLGVVAARVPYDPRQLRRSGLIGAGPIPRQEMALQVTALQRMPVSPSKFRLEVGLRCGFSRIETLP